MREMRKTARGLGVVAMVVLAVGWAAVSRAADEERTGSEPAAGERSPRARALATAGAVAANTLPAVPTYVEPRCFVPYPLCKLSFAVLGVAAAAESLVMSGGSDMQLPHNLIHRGVGGDWFVTPRDMLGETKPDLLPEVAPARQEGAPDKFVPPPR